MFSTFIIIVITTLYCVVHSYTASNPFKSRVREKFGPEATRWYRLAYNLFSVVSFLPVIWLLRVLSDTMIYFIPLPWPILTLIVQVIGFIIIALGLSQTGIVSFGEFQPLLSSDRTPDDPGFVKSGIYGWVRHPLYFGGLLVIWPAASMTINLLAFLVICTVYFIVGARLEEKRYGERFGEEYVKYQNEVPMLIPDIRRLVNLVVKRNT